MGKICWLPDMSFIFYNFCVKHFYYEIMHMVHRDVHLGHYAVSILSFLPKLEYGDKFVVMP